MFSFAQIARWISIPLDPVSVEDWLGNREIFGPGENPSEEDLQLETAYQIEITRERRGENPGKELSLEVLLNGLEVTGLIDEKDYLIIAPSGKFKRGRIVLELQVSIGSDKSRRVNVVSEDILLVPVSLQNDLKIKIKAKEGAKLGAKNDLEWKGKDKDKIIIDTRGRPLPDFPMDQQRELIAKLKQQLG